MLAESGVERPFYVTDLIVSRSTGVDRALLIARNDDEIPEQRCEGIFAMARRRVAREPLSYILGEAEFYGRPFKVGPCCLIPRPETELLVEAMLKLAPRSGRFADWCTGSGCIGITIALENPGLSGVGVDSSAEALAWAAENAALHGTEGRFSLILNSEPSEAPFSAGEFDFIIANPPYIPEDEMPTLMADVRCYEPDEALNGGKDGVELYEKFFECFPLFIKSGGYLGVETAGDKQCELLTKMAPGVFVLYDRIYDYGGKLRHLVWQKA